MKKMELHSTKILSNEDAKNELIYSFLCECERLFGWMHTYGFDFTDIRSYVFVKISLRYAEISFFGELMELLFGEFKWTKGCLPLMKIPANIFKPIMKKAYKDKKLIHFNNYSKRFEIIKIAYTPTPKFVYTPESILLQQLYETFGAEKFTTKEIIKMPELETALENISTNKEMSKNTRSIGRFLTKIKGISFNGLILKSTKSNITYWNIENLKGD